MSWSTVRNILLRSAEECQWARVRTPQSAAHIAVSASQEVDFAEGRITGMPEFTAETDFSFIAERSLRELVEDYFQQARAAYACGAYLGTLVACGGVLEGVLAWALSSNGITATKGKRPIEDCSLVELIQEAKERELIGRSALDSAWAVKQFPSFIHPYSLLRSKAKTSARLDGALAMNSLTAVQEIVRSVRSRLPRSAGQQPDLGRALALLDTTVLEALSFRWLAPGRLAGCRAPRSDRDLAMLKSLGIEALVRLTADGETFVTAEGVQAAGLEDCHLPIADFEAPTQPQVDTAVRFVLKALRSSRGAAVSCGTGYGRSGTILASVLVATGEPVTEALGRIETQETGEQEAAVRTFAERLERGEVDLSKA